MKKYLSISFIALSTMLFVLINVLPHHHHGDRACMIMEQCEQNEAVNDNHSHHSDSHGSMKHQGTCNLEVPAEKMTIKIQSPAPDSARILLPLLTVLNQQLLLMREHTENAFAETRFLNTYTPVELSRHLGLRAPPAA